MFTFLSFQPLTNSCYILCNEVRGYRSITSHPPPPPEPGAPDQQHDGGGIASQLNSKIDESGTPGIPLERMCHYSILTGLRCHPSIPILESSVIRESLLNLGVAQHPYWTGGLPIIPYALRNHPSILTGLGVSPSSLILLGITTASFLDWGSPHRPLCS